MIEFWEGLSAPVRVAIIWAAAFIVLAAIFSLTGWGKDDD